MPMLVSDYDLKQYTKKHFFERPAVFMFLEHTEDFFKSESVAQPGEKRKGATEASAPFSQSFKK